MRREPVAVVAVAAVGGLLLLVAEPGVGLVALAGTAAAVLLQPRPRRLVAAVLVLVGLATAVAGVAAGRWLLVTGAAMVAAAAVVATVRSPGWRASTTPPAEPGADPPGDLHRPSDRDTWAALDRGEDPTA